MACGLSSTDSAAVSEQGCGSLLAEWYLQAESLGQRCEWFEFWELFLNRPGKVVPVGVHGCRV